MEYINLLLDNQIGNLGIKSLNNNLVYVSNLSKLNISSILII